jgi:hypothetical protein
MSVFATKHKELALCVPSAWRSQLCSWDVRIPEWAGRNRVSRSGRCLRHATRLEPTDSFRPTSPT